VIGVFKKGGNVEAVTHTRRPREEGDMRRVPIYQPKNSRLPATIRTRRGARNNLVSHPQKEPSC
jgi:hypothetical protein